MLNIILSTSFYMISTTLSLHLVDLGMTVAVAGTIIGAMPLAAMLIRPFSGWICDNFNRKYLLTIFLVLNALSIAAYGIVTSETAFLAIRLLHGISFSITTTVSMALIAGYIPKKRMGEGLGYFGIAQTVAMAIGPSIGLALAQVSGSRSMFLFAALCVVISMISLFYLREEKSEDPHFGRKELRLRFGDFIVKEAVLFSIISFALASANGIENSYIALYGQQFGFLNVGWYFTLSAVVLLISRLLFSKVMDRRGFSFVFYPGLICVGTSFLLLSYATGTNALYVFATAAIIKALGIGAMQPALQASVMQRVKPERRGAATSTFYIGTDLGQASSPYMAGKMIDTNGYPDMFRIYIIPLIVVGVLYSILKWMKEKK